MVKQLFLVTLKSLVTDTLKFDKKGKGKGRTLLVAFAVLCIPVSLFNTFALLFDSLLEPFYSAGTGWLYFTFLALIMFSLCVVSTIFTASAQLFGAKDNELLLSMPIKPSTILISRILVVLLFEYAFALITALPAFAVWLKGGYATAAGTLFLIAGILLLPLLALTVSLLLAWLLGAVTARLRHKNIITLVVSIGFLFAYFYFYSNIQRYLNELLINSEKIAAAFQTAMPPFYSFGVSVSDGDIKSGLIFALWALLPFATAIAVLSSNYNKILITNRTGAKAVYKEKTARAGGVFFALLRNELSRYWNKPFVILNSSMGAIFMLVICVLVFVKKTELLLYLSGFSAVLGRVPSSALIAGILAFINATNNISASLISLEGKSLWILRSLPIPAVSILQAKISTHLLITGIPCLAASICTAIALSGTFRDALIYVLLPQTAGLLAAVAGIAVNLRFPKLEWKNEIYVVKQGLSAMITLFGSMGLLALLGMAYAFLLRDFVSLTAFLWFCSAAFIMAATAVYAWLAKYGADKFNKL